MASRRKKFIIFHSPLHHRIHVHELPLFVVEEHRVPVVYEDLTRLDYKECRESPVIRFAKRARRNRVPKRGLREGLDADGTAVGDDVGRGDVALEEILPLKRFSEVVVGLHVVCRDHL